MSSSVDAVPRLRLVWFGRTVTGLVRTNNEDTLWAAPLDVEGAKAGDSDGDRDVRYPGLLFAVADGMGGALAGEVASGLAVSTVGSEMSRRTAGAAGQTPPTESLPPLLIASVETANTQILGEGESNAQRRGMGTTLTAVWVPVNTAEIAQVGDSRAYLFRGGHLQQLTKDQSLVGKLLEDRIITEEEAERLPHKNIILQALGSEEPLDVVHQSRPLKPGDVLLLCTDGLTGVVNNRDLEEEFRRGGTPQALCERLIALAEKKGGPDNITVVIVRAETAR